MTVVGTDLIKTLDTLEKIEEVGRAVGNSDPCNPLKTVEMLVEMIIELGIDLYNGVISIGKLAGKNALFVILILLQETVGPILMGAHAGVLGFLTGNVIGTLMQGLALIISSVQGIWLILMYLALKTVRNAILERQTIIRSYIITPIENLIALLKAIQNLDLIETMLGTEYDKLKQAYDHVYTASIILGTELEMSGALVSSQQITNISTGATESSYALVDGVGKGVNLDSLVEAKLELDSAVDALFGGQVSALLETTEAAFTNAGVSFTGATDTSLMILPQALLNPINYGGSFDIDDPASTVNPGTGSNVSLSWDNLTTVMENLWDSAVKTQYSFDWEALLENFPGVIKVMALQTLVDKGIDDLSNKVPMFGSGIAKQLELLNSVTESNNLEGLFDSTAGDANLGHALSDIKQHADSFENFTLKKVNDKVALTELSIITLKTNFLAAAWAGNTVALALLPILSNLKVVRDDMRSALKGTTKFPTSKKMSWGLQIQNISANLGIFTTGLNLPGVGDVNYLDGSNAAMVESEWNALSLYLEGLETQPADTAYDLLRTLPGKAFKTIATGGTYNVEKQQTLWWDMEADLEDNSPEGFIALLQDIKTNLHESQTVDGYVFNQATTIMELIEQNDTFETLMMFWENLTSNLTGPMAQLGSELAAGNLNSMVNALTEFSSAFSSVSAIGKCAKDALGTPPGVSFDVELSPEEYAIQHNFEKAQETAQDASNKLIESLSGITDDDDFKEFLERKEQLKTQFINESAKLESILARLTMLYSLVT